VLNFSVIIPVLNARDIVRPLANKLLDLYQGLEIEIIFIDDGSQDGSQEILKKIEQEYPSKVKVCIHKENFGEHSAIYTGLQKATKKWAVILACDFQNPPEEIIKLLLLAESENFDVVYGQFVKKEHSFFKNLGSYIVNRLARVIIKAPSELHLSNFKCTSRRIYKNIGKAFNPLPLIDLEIIKQTKNIGKVQVIHHKSMLGKSHYNLERYFSLMLRISYNVAPTPLKNLILKFYARYFPVLH